MALASGGLAIASGVLADLVFAAALAAWLNWAYVLPEERFLADASAPNTSPTAGARRAGSACPAIETRGRVDGPQQPATELVPRSVQARVAANGRLYDTGAPNGRSIRMRKPNSLPALIFVVIVLIGLALAYATAAPPYYGASGWIVVLTFVVAFIVSYAIKSRQSVGAGGRVAARASSARSRARACSSSSRSSRPCPTGSTPASSPPRSRRRRR